MSFPNANYVPVNLCKNKKYNFLFKMQVKKALCLTTKKGASSMTPIVVPPITEHYVAS